MRIRPDHVRGVTNKWPAWVKTGTFVRPVNPDDPRTRADAAATATTTAGHNTDDDPHSRVQIVEMLTTAFTNVQDYTEPVPAQTTPSVATDTDGNMAPQPIPPEPLAAFASLKEVARFHNLCEKQYHAFLLLGSVLLHYKLVAVYGQDIVDAACNTPEPAPTGTAPDDTPLPNSALRDVMKVIMHLLGTEPGSNKVNQLVMFCGGEAGTGKTEVTKALTTLADKWNLTHAFHKTATTGAAASLINGCTIHQLGKLMYKIDNVVYDDALKIALALTDEVSMFHRAENGYLTQTLQKLLNCPGKVLGGVGGEYPRSILYDTITYIHTYIHGTSLPLAPQSSLSNSPTLTYALLFILTPKHTQVAV